MGGPPTKCEQLLFFPSLALSLTVLGINLLGDTLRDTLHPRLRGLGGRAL